MKKTILEIVKAPRDVHPPSQPVAGRRVHKIRLPGLIQPDMRVVGRDA
ncbi:MAG: hypothetical protein AB7F75_05195 [Planctomycetota bacterium]